MSTGVYNMHESHPGKETIEICLGLCVWIPLKTIFIYPLWYQKMRYPKFVSTGLSLLQCLHLVHAQADCSNPAGV